MGELYPDAMELYPDAMAASILWSKETAGAVMVYMAGDVMTSRAALPSNGLPGTRDCAAAAGTVMSSLAGTAGRGLPRTPGIIVVLAAGMEAGLPNITD